jgi:hypothetical protein
MATVRTETRDGGGNLAAQHRFRAVVAGAASHRSFNGVELQTAGESFSRRKGRASPAVASGYED